MPPKLLHSVVQVLIVVEKVEILTYPYPLQYCHKKPKFQGFEFCGKNCAAQANPSGTKGVRSGAPSAGASQQAHKGAGTYSKGGNNPNTQQQQQQQRQQTAPVIDPVQIASQ